MSESASPQTPLPEAKADGYDEESVLLGYLAYHRAVLVRKAEGITDEQAQTAACPPSEMTLMGLIRHMTEVERGWFRRGFGGEDLPPVYVQEAHPDGDEDGDFHPPPGTTMAETFDAYWAEVALCDAHIAARDMDDIIRTEKQESSARRIIVHLIEEYARHCGHADLLRQAIDGTVGD